MTSVFKQYYSNPEFKEKHLTYMKEKVPCPDCSKNISRSHMSNHRKRTGCMSKREQEQIGGVRRQNKKLKRELERIKERLMAVVNIPSDTDSDSESDDE